jgi:UDP-N-acetylmuramoyl-L-alanyl-D-glutamate--2,6-diaminopimelate ligase
VSFFTKSVLNLSGLKAGYIGTLFYETDRRIPASETTPSIIKIAPLLKEMVDKNLKACIMEVSSHALHQDRILGLKFDVAAFTNLSRDHLDYHKGMEEYYQAKKKLFTCYLKSSGKAVISLETEYGRRLAKELEESLKERIMVVNNGEINVKILDNKNGLAFLINLFGKNYKIQTQLFGDYQARNVATVCGILLSLGYKPEDIVEYLKELKNPVGRLELVASYKGAKIFVDYAHTPSALEEVLKSLQSLKKRRIFLVFGCGGNRDKGKRALMGEVACKFSDYIILTSDNPRFEDPLRIIEDIKKGINGTLYEVIPDRREAIKKAVELLEEGDVLLIAGKGHETYQEICGKRYPFSDQEEVLKAIQKEGG